MGVRVRLTVQKDAGLVAVVARKARHQDKKEKDLREFRDKKVSKMVGGVASKSYLEVEYSGDDPRVVPKKPIERVCFAQSILCNAIAGRPEIDRNDDNTYDGQAKCDLGDVVDVAHKVVARAPRTAAPVQSKDDHDANQP